MGRVGGAQARAGAGDQLMGLFARAIQPPDPIPTDSPGDPTGVVVEEAGPFVPLPPFPPPAPWAGWPADWGTAWSNGQLNVLADTAWLCIDLNSSTLADMPPYLKNAAPSLSADWLINPDPDVYASWHDFIKQAFWDYQAVGEAFVLATAWYATGWPARFHVAPPWTVQIELDQGVRRYTIGDLDVTDRILHVRYSGGVDVAHGVGPLEAGQARMVAAQVLTQYGTKLAAGGGIPPGTLEHPEELSAEQSALLKAQWVQARVSAIGEPAVLSGGITWKPAAVNPKDMALVELLQFNEARIATLLGVPPFLVGLPSGGDSMTYSNSTALFDFHWRAGLKPKAGAMMAALSGWALPRGTTVELNRDAYVQPGPLERAQTAQILAGIVDPATGQQALSVDEIRAAERLDNSTPGVLA
jgi:HK97 family phage portal protein